MGYRMLGRMHAAIIWAARNRGQGTVEYVGLILLVAVVLAGVVAATKRSGIGGGQIAQAILKQIKAALDQVK